jgi:dihydropteroate synthase
MEVTESYEMPTESIILDPGSDVGKTPHQPLVVLGNVHAINALNRPVFLALYRKDFLGAIMESLPKLEMPRLSAQLPLRGEGGKHRSSHDLAAASTASRP